jgi:hypothetical protein
MLERLLQILGSGGTYTLADLARELEVTEELAEMMIEELAQMGYLAPLQKGCTRQCAACPVSGSCSVGGASHAWTLTGKARGGGQ